jgi:hypothetical protein
MKIKVVLAAIALLPAIVCPCQGQTLVGKAAGDFFSAYAKYGMGGRHLGSLEDLEPFITIDVRENLDESIVYRTAFIGYAANQLGVITGVTSSVGFAETLSAITGFLMLVEEAEQIREWTVREITDRHEQLIATSWPKANPPLFARILEAYCAYKRGELW